MLTQVDNGLHAAVLELMLRAGEPVSRTVLSESIGLSRSVISGEVRRLIAAGLLEEEGFAASDGGRRSTLLSIPERAGLVAAIDLGATSIDVALTTLAADVLAHRGEAADVGDGPEAILGRASQLVDQLLSERTTSRDAISALAVGVPGPVEQAGGRLDAPPIMPGWDGFSVRDALEREYGRPVVVDNDVNTMALGEHFRGVGRGVDDMLFVKIGTGIGGGLIIDGRLYRGVQGCAADIGHIEADPHGPICACGNVGCLEALAAAPAIVRKAEIAARSGASPVLAARLAEKESLDATDVGDAASRGDYEALTIIRDSGRLIGLTLASVVSVLNPSLIVVGGGVSRIGDALLAEIRTAVYKRSLPLSTRSLPIVLSGLDPLAGVIGASVLACQRLLAAPIGGDDGALGPRGRRSRPGPAHAA